MKTSNKILLSLIVVLFATPILVSMSLKSKIRNKDFVTKTNNYRSENERSGDVAGSKVISIVSPGKSMLNCHLTAAQTAGFTYTLSEEKDSARIFNNNDTLFVEYVQNKGVALDQETDSEFRENSRSIEVYLRLPSFEQISATHANVILDSVPPAVDLLDISLVWGSLIAGFEDGGKEVQLKELKLTGKNTDLTLGPRFTAQNLNLNLAGNTSLDMGKANINEVHGTISDSTVTNASWKHLKHLTPRSGN